MFSNLNKCLYYNRKQILFNNGVNEESITPIAEDFYKVLSCHYHDCLPVSLFIKYLRPDTLSFEENYKRSLYMFLCFDNALLVNGNNKYLELKNGKENSLHSWIELGDYCYDPMSLLKYKKDIFYKIYEPTNVSKLTLDEYKNSSDFDDDLYQEITTTKLDDFKPTGEKRGKLSSIMPSVIVAKKMKNDENFNEELDRYLREVEYTKTKFLYKKIDKCIK